MEAKGKAVQTRVLGDGLSQLKRQFDQWRAGRKVGERIPFGIMGLLPLEIVVDS